jgi:hypothetical protein
LFRALAQIPSAAAPFDVQKSFDTLKTLAGNWQGPVTADDPAWATDKPLEITMRVASQGNALIHELKGPRFPEVTMLYVDSDTLTLVHYCDYKNRTRMVARPSRGGNKIEFDLVEMAGIDAPGHVTHAVFTIIDANHHTEEWTFLIPGKKPVHAIMDLKRVKWHGGLAFSRTQGYQKSSHYFCGLPVFVLTYVVLSQQELGYGGLVWLFVLLLMSISLSTLEWYWWSSPVMAARMRN